MLQAIPVAVRSPNPRRSLAMWSTPSPTPGHREPRVVFADESTWLSLHGFPGKFKTADRFHPELVATYSFVPERSGSRYHSPGSPGTEPLATPGAWLDANQGHSHVRS